MDPYQSYYTNKLNIFKRSVPAIDDSYMRQNPGELDKLKELADMGAWRKTYRTGERELDEYLVLYSKAAWAIRRDEIDAAKAESEAKDKARRSKQSWAEWIGLR